MYPVSMNRCSSKWPNAIVNLEYFINQKYHLPFFFLLQLPHLGPPPVKIARQLWHSVESGLARLNVWCAKYILPIWWGGAPRELITFHFLHDARRKICIISRLESRKKSYSRALPTPPPSLEWPHFFIVFFRASKSYFFLVARLSSPPPLLVSGPLKKNCFPYSHVWIVPSTIPISYLKRISSIFF